MNSVWKSALTTGGVIVASVALVMSGLALAQAPEPAATDPDAAEENAEFDGAATALRRALQPLVDDATISAEQADAVATHLDRHRPVGKARKAIALASEALGVEPEELLAALRDGATIKALAAEAGVAVAAVTAALLDPVANRIDEALAAGRLTPEEADQALSRAEARVDEFVTAEHPLRGRASSRHPAGRIAGAMRLADALGLEIEDLRTALQDFTVADLAEQQGVALDELVDSLMESAIDRVDAAVAAGEIDRAQADERLEAMRVRLLQRFSGESG